MIPLTLLSHTLIAVNVWLLSPPSPLPLGPLSLTLSLTNLAALFLAVDTLDVDSSETTRVPAIFAVLVAACLSISRILTFLLDCTLDTQRSFAWVAIALAVFVGGVAVIVVTEERKQEARRLDRMAWRQKQLAHKQD